VRVRVLGAAAGGGFPQWNCVCSGCRAARSEPARAKPRTHSSVAVRAPSGRWLLINASPDVADQLETLYDDGPAELAAVVLTDAELDHTLGLLRLREHETPLTVVATPYVRRVLSVDFPIDSVLSHWAGVIWRDLLPGAGPIDIDGLMVEALSTGVKGPRFAASRSDEQAVVAIVVGPAALVCAPAVERIDSALESALCAAGCVLFDGTCWTDDELLSVRAGGRTATQMGHLPLSGPSGSLHTLRALDVRRVVLIHVNNTNPVLLDDSPERAALQSMGVEIAQDGLELAL
jgi:pyrroloquinoline quinone biosynthesis protein B